MKINKIFTCRTLFFAFSLALAGSIQAQDLPEQNFYQHLQGHINNTIQVSANIIRLQDTIYGNYYYWYFEHESNEKHISKQIPLQGNMLSPTEFVLNEYTREGSYFDGIIVNAQSFEGNWINEEAEKSLGFEMVQKNPKGTVPFDIFRLKDRKTLSSESGSPTAAIDITLLKPADYPTPSVSDSITKLLYTTYGYDNIELQAEEILSRLKKEYFKKYIEANEEIYEGGVSFNWLKISRHNVVLNEDYVLTLEFSNFAFTGGAHGLLVNKYHVMDLTNGKKVKADDIFIKNYREELQAVLNDVLKEKNEISGDKSLTSAGFFVDTVELSNNFYLQKTGIGFYYNNYEIAPYSAGHIDIFIPYEKLRDILKPEGIVSRIYEF